MKIFHLIFFATFSLNVVARLSNYTLSALPVKDSTPIENLYLQAVLEDSSTLYFFLGNKSDGVTISCEPSGYTCYVLYNGRYFTLGLDYKDFLVASTGGGYQDYAPVEIDSTGHLYIKGYYYYALKYASDSIMYSDDHFVIKESVDGETKATYELRLLLQQTTLDAIDTQRVLNPSDITLYNVSEPVVDTYRSINYHFYSYTEDGESPVEINYLQATLESKDTLYFFLDQARSTAIVFTCDQAGHRCYVNIEGEIFYLGVNDENFIIATKEEDVNININIGTSLQSVYINGYDFLASDEVEDPLLYSKQRPVLLLGNFTSNTSKAQFYSFRLQLEQVSLDATDYQVFENPASIPLHNQSYSSTSRAVSAYLTLSVTNSRATASTRSASKSYTYSGYTTTYSSSKSNSGTSSSAKVGIVLGTISFIVICAIAGFTMQYKLGKNKRQAEANKELPPPYTP